MRRPCSRLGTLLALVFCLAIPGAAAEPAPRRLPGWSSSAWRPFAFGNIDRHTRYTTVDEGWLRAESDCGASARVLPLDDFDLRETPVLHWRWRVDTPLAIENERSKAGDDFAARVYVMFRFEPETATWFERVRHRLGAAAYDLEPPGTALSLVWSSREPGNAMWKSPYSEESAMVVVAGGATRKTGAWYEESVNLLSTYRAAFGAEPPPLQALGVMTDADNTCSRASAGFESFRFSAGD